MKREKEGEREVHMRGEKGDHSENGEMWANSGYTFKWAY